MTVSALPHRWNLFDSASAKHACSNCWVLLLTADLLLLPTLLLTCFTLQWETPQWPHSCSSCCQCCT